MIGAEGKKKSKDRSGISTSGQIPQKMSTMSIKTWARMSIGALFFFFFLRVERGGRGGGEGERES